MYSKIHLVFMNISMLKPFFLLNILAAPRDVLPCPYHDARSYLPPTGMGCHRNREESGALQFLVGDDSVPQGSVQHRHAHQTALVPRFTSQQRPLLWNIPCYQRVDRTSNETPMEIISKYYHRRRTNGSARNLWHPPFTIAGGHWRRTQIRL